MADNINDAEPIGIDSAFLLAYTMTGGTVDLRHVPGTNIAPALALANTALQPADLGDSGKFPADYYLTVDQYNAALAAQNAYIVALETRITQLEAMIGVSNVIVFENNVFEPGVFVS